MAGVGGHTEDPGVVAITNQEAPQLWSSILHTHAPAQHQHTGRHSQTPDHPSLQSLSQAPTIQFLKGKRGAGLHLHGRALHPICPVTHSQATSRPLRGKRLCFFCFLLTEVTRQTWTGRRRKATLTRTTSTAQPALRWKLTA